MKSRAAILLLLTINFAGGLGAVLAEEGKRLPMGDWLTLQTAALEKMCVQERQKIERAAIQTEGKTNLVLSKDNKGRLEFTCGCAPEAVSDYNNSLSVEDRSVIMTQKKYASLIKPQMIERCLAAHLRGTFDDLCLEERVPLPEGATNKATFCACMSKEFKALPDKEIVKGAESVKAQLEEAKLQLEGRLPPEPIKRNGFVVEWLKKCGVETK